MPSISAHMIVSSLVSKKLNIDNEDFIKGNLLPDISKDKNSHYKIKGKYFLIPDIDMFKKANKINNYLYKGYLSHLLLDKYYLEEFVPKYITKTAKLFIDGTIYKEYDKINYRLLNNFNIDINYLNKVLSSYKIDINKEKLDYNIKCLNYISNDEPNIIDINKFSKFLVDSSNKIVRELKKI